MNCEHGGSVYDCTDCLRAEVNGLDAEIARLKSRNDTAETVLASATDLGNSWAREACVMEARTTYEIGSLIDRLWACISRDHNKLREERDRLAEEIAGMRGERLAAYRRDCEAYDLLRIENYRLAERVRELEDELGISHTRELRGDD